jgi:hypothetical protein
VTAPSDLIKIRLTDRGEDSETSWAHDLGPATDGPDGSRRVRLANIPFLHAKPTFGDVLVVSPDPDDDEDSFLVWDRKGVSWAKISSRIAEDSGNWAMIVDYAPSDGTTADRAWEALRDACDRLEITVEGAWGPADDKPGRAYLAVAADIEAESIMERLSREALPCELIQIHPKPAAPKKARAAKTAAKANAKTKAAKTAAKPKPKAKAKPKAKTKTKPTKAKPTKTKGKRK